jgi:urease accessory protein
MILVNSVLGNEKEPGWAERLAAGRADLLHLDQWQAQKNRFRLRAESGEEVAVALARGTQLRDGDVLYWDESGRGAIVARISLQDVMVIRLAALLGQPVDVISRTCVELGHALGNQHWPAVFKEAAIYVPLTVDRKVMASVMGTHAFEHITFDFQPGAEVIPYLAPHEARRLFGGADATIHSHLPRST